MTADNPTGKPYDLETKVPHFGPIKAVKRGAMEYEYLLFKDGVTTWLSHSDIEAMFEANPTPKQPDPIMQILNKLITDIDTLTHPVGRFDLTTIRDKAHQQLQAYFDTEIRNSLATYEKELLIDYEADKAEAVRLGKIAELERAKLQGYINGHRMHSVDHRIAKLKREL